MTLTFPTQAEQAVEAFRTVTKTVAFATVARRMGADVERTSTGWVYTFDDDTTATVTGVGASHRIETNLP